jgi:cell division protein FtsB
MDKIKIIGIRQAQDGTIEYDNGEKWTEISAEDLYIEFVNLENTIDTQREEIDDLENVFEDLKEKIKELNNEDMNPADLPKLGKNLNEVDKLELLRELFERCSREELTEIVKERLRD